ncbi:SH3 domain-containing protein [Methylobacterium sp. C25]|uniref:caspase family protein n=1 Tax=Methylobacterium sp. C25 TaxID=2721622 RepID=UPI002D7F916A|nr:caspase family protein [Methylobacterium sp. C25]MCE4226399.1 SH3 domain-containing protein [Methylobacterium sp. C25]
MRRIGQVWLLALFLWPACAQAAERLAFVVGVGAYQNLGQGAQLARPPADAQTVGDTLQGLGFRVTLLSNAVTQETFLRRFSIFADQVQPGDTALVYFAGHGIAIQGTNYLLPSDIPAVEAGQEMLARSRSLAETDLSAALRQRGARVVVMVIDACRNNPFSRNGTRAIGQDTGLARTEPADGVFSLYAAGAGQQALEKLPGSDPNPNSVFTRIFVQQIRKPGLNLIDLGESVRDEVAKLAETVPHKQVPAYYNEVRGARFVSLASADAASLPAAAPVTVSPPDPSPPQAILPPPAQTKPALVIKTPPSSIVYPPPASTLMRPQAAPPPVADALPPPEPTPVARFGMFSHPIRLDPAGDNWVALRSLPSGQTGYRIAKLGPDSLFSVIGRQGIWVKVKLRGGPVGWVHGDYVGCCRRALVEP